MSSWFPSDWKKAVITPLPKPGDPTKVSNLRPISILPVVGKLQEKLAHQYLYDFLEEHNILSPHQYGYRKELSTGEAVFDLANDIFDYRDRGQGVVATFIDMKKAFDSVHHGILLQKLTALGLHKNFLKWVENYLMFRTQKTKTVQGLSGSRNISFGVPQGSVLGPLLFILFVNDIPEVIRYSKIAMYADDVVVYSSQRNHRLAVVGMQNDLNSIGTWCRNNCMTINETKTKVMWFASANMRKTLPDLDLKINDKKLSEVKHYMYLGAELDSDFTLVKFVNNTVSKVSVKVFKLGKLRITVTEWGAIAVYKQAILPLMDYCCFLAESARRDPTHKLQVIQNQALRICLRVRIRDETIEGLHARTEVPMLKDRRKELLAALMYRKSKKVKPAVKVRNTRSDGKFLFPRKRVRSAMCEKSPFNRGVALWDKLDSTVQMSKNKQTFKTAIKKLYGTNVKGSRKKFYAARRQNLHNP